MTADRTTPLEWVLRIGACMCFVGHGAFGVLTKEGWVPYFAVVGIGRETAYTLMPLIGALDVTMGLLVLAWPVNLALAWMALWAIWTASLRPLSGEPLWEALERAGNYGVPVAMLALSSAPRSWRALGARFQARELSAETLVRVRWALQVTVALLLVGHGALGVIGKHGLIVNYSSVMSAGAAASIAPLVGWGEIVLALGVFARVPALLVGIAAWKMATEALFVSAGAPVWEWVERGGSYAAPLALAIVLVLERAVERRAATSAS